MSNTTIDSYPFCALALGAKFRYLNGASRRTYVKILANQVLELDEHQEEGVWLGQGTYSFTHRNKYSRCVLVT